MNPQIIKTTKFLFSTLNQPLAIIGSTALYLHYENQKEKLENVTSAHYRDVQKDVDFIGYVKDYLDLRNDFPLFMCTRFNKFHTFYFEDVTFDIFTDKYHWFYLNTEICVNNTIIINDLPVLSLPCLLALKIQAANHEVRSLFGKGVKDIEDIIHILYLMSEEKEEKQTSQYLNLFTKEQLDFITRSLSENIFYNNRYTLYGDDNMMFYKNEAQNKMNRIRGFI